MTNNTYIVTFETASQENLEKIEKLLKTYPGYCPIHKYCWAIFSDSKPIDIHNHLKQALGLNDRLFVIRSGTMAAWSNSYGEQHDEWLKKNL